ncbi:MAG: alpha-ketoacid dehydrogenase subunit beta [Armatimonadetes bacterium]|nr:alpha-ketoacid dehydrogenase subunit beta [Armatimonadota bacterium]
MREITYREALREALIEELDRDEKVFLIGEDIGRYQGTFRVTEGLFEKYGPHRVWDAPISEPGFTAIAVGAAIDGLRPVVEMMTWSFGILAMDQIVNHAAKILYKSGGMCPVPMVIRGPAGPGKQLAAQHSHSLESWFAHSPGLKVALPATPADAKGLLKTSIRDSNPIVFMEHPHLYGVKGPVPEGEHLVPFGVADIKREGSDATIITYSRGVHLALEAAETLSKEGIEIEIVDLRTINPIDMETAINSVAKTHRAVVVHDDWKFAGFGGEIIAQIQEQAFDELDAPILRVAGADVPMPYAKNLEQLAIPHAPDIVEAVKQTLQ